MKVRELSLTGALEFTPARHSDERGTFMEWFREDEFVEATGHSLWLAQVNCSVSARGVLRGIHFAELPPSQAKYISCAHGAVHDVMVDLRVGSPTFGRWEAVVLDDRDCRAVYVPEGFGHAFCALTDGAVVNYLCSAPYAPGREHGIDPFDPELAIAWPDRGADDQPLHYVLSPKDEAAPSLAEIREQGLLPSYEQWLAFTGGRSARPAQ